jgi:hypothetical protein
MFMRFIIRDCAWKHVYLIWIWIATFISFHSIFIRYFQVWWTFWASSKVMAARVAWKWQNFYCATQPVQKSTAAHSTIFRSLSDGADCIARAGEMRKIARLCLLVVAQKEWMANERKRGATAVSWVNSGARRGRKYGAFIMPPKAPRNSTQEREGGSVRYGIACRQRARCRRIIVAFRPIAVRDEYFLFPERHSAKFNLCLEKCQFGKQRQAQGFNYTHIKVM